MNGEDERREADDSGVRACIVGGCFGFGIDFETELEVGVESREVISIIAISG